MLLKKFLISMSIVFLFDSVTFADSGGYPPIPILATNCKQSSASLSQYVNCKIREVAAREMPAKAGLEVQETDLSKQSEANSAASNSTTLADHTTGSDFVASSLAFPGLASKSSVPNSTDYSV